MSASPLLPSVSVVVPIYNRAGFLDMCLPPLLAQTYPHNRYEIILVDDGSTDNTIERANSLAQGWDGPFHVISKRNGGPASARNAGIQASQADIIAFIDSDCVADTTWLEIIVRAMVSSQAAGLGAPIVNIKSNNWIARYMDAMNFYRHRVRKGRVDYLITGNVAFCRSALIEVGGFEDQPGVWVEDVDLSFKLIAAGYKLEVTNSGAVQHYGPPLSVRALAKNLFRYGRGNYMLSSRWKNNRKPPIEFIRHTGAVFLAPVIAASKIRMVGLWQALSFIPLIMIEHSAFALGMVSAAIQKWTLGKR